MPFSRIMMLVLVAIVGLLAVWFLIHDDDEQLDVKPTSRTLVPGPQKHAPRSTALTHRPRVIPVGTVPKEEDIRTSITTGKTEPERVPEPAFPDDDPCVAKTPLHVPDYGAGIERAGGRALFTLEDAMGEELEPQPDRIWSNNRREENEGKVKVALWRKLGRYWCEVGVKYDERSCRVDCCGDREVGLEPGEYELEVEAGPYGTLRHRFLLGHGGRIEHRLRLPNWRRIICLRLLDQHGDPVPWVVTTPKYTHENAKLEPLARSEARGVLRDPPHSGQFGLGGGGGEIFRTRGSGDGFPSKIPTDQGRIHIRVFAGISGTVTLPLDARLFGHAEYTVSDTFTSSAWNQYDISLELAEHYAANMAERRTVGEDNPGWRLRPIGPRYDSVAEPPLDATIVKDGTRRLLVSAPAPVPLILSGIVRGQVVEMSGASEEENVARSKPLKGKTDPATGMLFLEIDKDWEGNRIVPGSEELEWWLCDDALLETEHWHTPLPSSGVLRESREIRTRKVSITATVSPTVAAFSVERRARFNEHWKDSKMVYADVALQRSETQLHANAWLLADALAFKRNSKSLSIQGTSFDPQHQNLFWYLVVLPTELKFSLQPLNGTEFQFDAETWEFAASPSQPGSLILRVVGDHGEGLPWVEASIIDEADDLMVKGVRRAFVPPSGIRPDHAELGKHVKACEDVAALTDENLRATMGEGAWELLEHRRSREHFCRNGAWYDSRRRLKSDEYGYMASTFWQLVKGKRYVMYLWSNSRDEMVPDRRIDFEAGEGVVDLGVIRLPGYAD